MNERSIDIVVPTFRLDEEILLGIIQLPKPVDFAVNIFIISDNPAADVPAAIRQLSDDGKINLLINAKNIGPPATRNVGINTGTGKWILLLDDDIKPRQTLLLEYAEAINQNLDALGFAGVTYFPEPFNHATKALYINGSVGSFTDAERKPSLIWSPTANVMLNRQKMDSGLFDASLINAEDIDFLVRNSLRFDERYISVPEAAVYHPWWNGGKIQTARMISYGTGASQIARKSYIKQYTFRDFTNTSETVLLLLLALPFAFFAGKTILVLAAIVAVVLAEFITNWVRAIKVGHTKSLAIAAQMMWAKNCWEFGFLYQSLSSGFMDGFARRIDMGFNKINPSPFRTNRWKIIKLAILAVLLVVLVKTL